MSLTTSNLTDNNVVPVDFAKSNAFTTETVRGEFTLELGLLHAGKHKVGIRYELQGPADAPLIIVSGGISANRHLSSSEAFPEKGWAETLVGKDKFLDPHQKRLLAVDFLGSDGDLDVPIDTIDQANAVAAVLEHLSIDHVDLFVGYSYGALVGLHFAAIYPNRVRQLVAVSGTHTPHPYASAWRALQRKAVALGQLQCAETHGLSLARQFAMLSYRSAEEFGERFEIQPQIVNGHVRVAAEDYLDSQGAKYVEKTPTAAFLRLSESIDLHKIDPLTIYTPTTVVAVDNDQLVPLIDSVNLVEGISQNTQANLRVIRSAYGHDAFLKETQKIDSILQEAWDTQNAYIEVEKPTLNRKRKGFSL